jgi:NADH-quinone oxidoreductase subunit J
LSLVLFYILAAIILIAALMVVTLRNVFHSALFLVLTFFLVAGIYLMLKAEFLAAVQVLIYVGAVTILILFAIMLTHKIQSGAMRQVNEQVVPAALIAGLFLALAITTVALSFKDAGTPSGNTGFWTASIDLSRLPAEQVEWDWTIDLEDRSGRSYIAAGSFAVLDALDETDRYRPDISAENEGYVISANPDFSTFDIIFAKNQTAYIKIWSDKVDYGSVTKAVWKIASFDDNEILVELSNSNTESIGRLLMSKFVLPFEIVSVLLLAALIGAIVIARKDT